MTMIITCAGCDKPILDKFLLNVLDRTWHAECVRCYDCHANLTEKCFSREGKLFCRNDFFRRYGTKCAGCSQGISPSDLVRKARDKVFHLNCFTCMVCRKQLSTGEELYVLDDNKFICKEDYLSGKSQQDPSIVADVLLNSGSEEEEDELMDANSAGGTTPIHANPNPAGSTTPTNNNSNSAPNNNNTSSSSSSSSGGGAAPATPSGQATVAKGEATAPIGTATSAANPATPAATPAGASGVVAPAEVKTEEKDSVQDSEGSIDGDTETRDSQTENKSPDDTNVGSKRRGPRTTIKAKQLEILKNAFAQTPKPTRHIREQLAKETGLPMRVIQVWFQNKRSKERRLKQLTSMGRGPFFGSSRKMRGFPMNMSPSMEEGPGPGFPYFSDNKFGDFAYAGQGFHDFFPGQQPGQGQNLAFSQPGVPGSLDPGQPLGGGGPMGEFGGLNPDPGFLPQGDLMSQRSSPDYMAAGW